MGQIERGLIMNHNAIHDAARDTIVDNVQNQDPCCRAPTATQKLLRSLECVVQPVLRLGIGDPYLDSGGLAVLIPSILLLSNQSFWSFFFGRFESHFLGEISTLLDKMIHLVGGTPH